MGTSVAVILANILKTFEKSSQKPNDGRGNKTDMKEMCIDCNRSETFRGKGVECISCKIWFLAKR